MRKVYSVVREWPVEGVRLSAPPLGASFATIDTDVVEAYEPVLTYADWRVNVYVNPAVSAFATRDSGTKEDPRGVALVSGVVADLEDNTVADQVLVAGPRVEFTRALITIFCPTLYFLRTVEIVIDGTGGATTVSSVTAVAESPNASVTLTAIA